jgi:hypothetical protein
VRSQADVDVGFWTALTLEAVLGRPSLLPHLAVVAMRASDLGRGRGLSEDDCRLLYVAGLLHDVGKAPAHVATGFHPLDGAVLAERHGAAEVACLVAHHTGARYEARMHGIAMPYEWEPSSLHDALMLADLTTGPDGLTTTLSERRVDIEARYAADSVEVRSLAELWPEALAAAERFNIASS